jgi:hypothetical protein
VEFVKKENLFHRLPIHRSRVDRVSTRQPSTTGSGS